MAPMTTSRKAVTGRGELRATRRTDALFKAMSSDYLLREQFITDPAQLLHEYVAGGRLDEGTADAANQLVYAVMSNPKTRTWLLEYARRTGGRTPDRHQFAVDFANAVASSGDPLVSLALIRAGSQQANSFVVQADVLRALLGILGGGISSGTEMSPGGGTEMSPGVTGTEMSPGAIFSGTEMSPGGGTEMSPGGGTEMSPGAILSGTEMSPGGGTEMSPGGGTEMSPGGSFTLPGHLRQTLQGLVDFSTQLRVSGALAVSGLEQR
jgi:hypothetical protein